MAYTIIIDGGGTNTHCVCSDGVHRIAEFHAASVKPTLAGYEECARTLFDLILQTCLEADVPFNRIKAIVVGMAGIWDMPECELLRDKLFECANAQMYALPTCIVVSDAELAYYGVFAHDEGICVISGTGSIAIGRDARGAMHRAGGYGPILSDEGSGTWIGRRALMHVLRCCDGRSRAGLLTERIAERMRLHLPEESRALAMLVNNGSIQTSDICPLVFECAAENDRNAQNILADASDKLMELALTAGRLVSRGTLPVAFIGGVGEHTMMQRRLRRKVEGSASLTWCARPADTVLGGLHLVSEQSSALSSVA